MLRRLFSISIALMFGVMAVKPAVAQSAFSRATTVPLTVTENATYGTYSSFLTIGLGSLKRFPIVFDTGSTGLRLFANPNVGLPGSGTVCSTIPTSVVYGNPGRIEYSGVVCYGFVHVGSLRTTQMVPFAQLTTVSCPPSNPNCTLAGNTPQERYARGDYGVFGSSLSLGDTLPNPLRMLPGDAGRRFAIRIMPKAGELVLGGPYFPGVAYPLVPQGNGMLGIPAFRSPAQCILVKTASGTVEDTGACPEVVYDTGNGVPFFYANVPGLPVTNGYVTPGTTVGFAPAPDGPVTTSVVASTAYAGQFRVDPTLYTDNLVNVGIQGCLGREIGFDAARTIERAGVITQGVMTIAPL